MRFRVTIPFVLLVLLASVQFALADLSEWRRPLSIPLPKDAQYDPRITRLGKMLFFDPRLSGAQNISYSSCHNPSFGWGAPVDRVIGAANTPLGRSAPSTLNVAWAGPLFFWDGQTHGLEEQAGGPITADAEMTSSFDQTRLRLGQVPEYLQRFDTLFLGESMTEGTINRVIATFERTIVAGWSPFGCRVDGDETALSASAQRGFDLFTGVAGCSNCHTGWNFTNGQFDDIGLPDDDPGRSVVTKDYNDDHKFKSPSLHNIALRAPYIHNGSLPTLESVANHYSAGVVNRPTTATNLMPFSVTG